MRNSLPLALLFLLTSSTLHAQRRFNGTWEMKMDTLQFSGPPEEYLLVKGTYHCETCVPKVDVETDGIDHKVTGHPYDTLAVRVVDNRTRLRRKPLPEKRDSLDSPKGLRVRTLSRASGACRPSRTRPAPAL